MRYGIVLLEVPYLISKAAGVGTGGVEVGEKSQHLLCLLSDNLKILENVVRNL